MTVDELARRMTSRELAEWSALYAVQDDAKAEAGARAALAARASAGAAGVKAKLGGAG